MLDICGVVMLRETPALEESQQTAILATWALLNAALTILHLLPVACLAGSQSGDMLRRPVDRERSQYT